jgi:hypothetical protein
MLKFHRVPKLPTEININFMLMVKERIVWFMSVAGDCFVLQSVQTSCGVQWVMEAVCMGVKQLWCEDDHASVSSVKIKNDWSYTSTVPYAFITVLLLCSCILNIFSHYNWQSFRSTSMEVNVKKIMFWAKNDWYSFFRSVTWCKMCASRHGISKSINLESHFLLYAVITLLGYVQALLSISLLCLRYSKKCRYTRSKHNFIFEIKWATCFSWWW